MTPPNNSNNPANVKTEDKSLSEIILNLRRYLPDPNTGGSMVYWQGDNKRNRGIYVDLGAIMGNLRQSVQRLKERFSSPDYYKWKDILDEINNIKMV